jgi:hypothetical protein
MTLIRTTRFQADPAATDELLAKRATLIATIRAGFPGLREARLSQLEDGDWQDAWVWESAEAMKTALAAAPTIPEAGAAFALTREPTAEVARLVDER